MRYGRCPVRWKRKIFNAGGTGLARRFRVAL